MAVLADVDEALGNYVRGMFLECCLLGVTVIVFIAIVGVPLRWAIAIGIFTGASNIVPYMGFAAALLSGLGKLAATVNVGLAGYCRWQLGPRAATAMLAERFTTGPPRVRRSSNTDGW